MFTHNIETAPEFDCDWDCADATVVFSSLVKFVGTTISGGSKDERGGGRDGTEGGGGGTSRYSGVKEVGETSSGLDPVGGFTPGIGAETCVKEEKTNR